MCCVVMVIVPPIYVQLIGVEECTKRLNGVLTEAKQKSGLDPLTKLKCVVS